MACNPSEADREEEGKKTLKMEPLIPREWQAGSQHECKGITVDSEELFQKHTRVSDSDAYLIVGERQKRKWAPRSGYLFPAGGTEDVTPRRSLSAALTYNAQ
ncbi:UNVERIFIED_CONTAM: hypothetical protein FKN15_010773 [Acipenser sinensis]